MKVEALAITSPDRNGQASAPAAVAMRRLEALLRFGGLMLSAGETAFRVRRSMGDIACGLGFESLSVQLVLAISSPAAADTARLRRWCATWTCHP